MAVEEHYSTYVSPVCESASCAMLLSCCEPLHGGWVSYNIVQVGSAPFQISFYSIMQDANNQTVYNKMVRMV